MKTTYKTIKMKLPNIVEIEEAFKGTDFGMQSKETVLTRALSKTIRGYWNGHTAHQILKRLNLIQKHPDVKGAYCLTERGAMWLNKHSIII